MNDPSRIDGPTFLERLAAAIEFLTRVSVPRMRLMSEVHYAIAQRQGVVFFPLVGGLVGVFTASVFLIMLSGLSPWIAAFIAVGCEALVTGAFHEDALADTCDALGGGWSREQVLEIMKDSRVGAYGALGLVVGVGMRVACFAELASISERWAFLSIVSAAALSRIAIIGMMVTIPAIVDRASQAREMSNQQTMKSLARSATYSLPCWGIWFLSSPGQAIGTILACIMMLALFRNRILQRVAGTTGDLLGCAAFMTQTLVLVGSSWSGAST